jgi:hypothetical protein
MSATLDPRLIGPPPELLDVLDEAWIADSLPVDGE